MKPAVSVPVNRVRILSARTCGSTMPSISERRTNRVAGFTDATLTPVYAGRGPVYSFEPLNVVPVAWDGQLGPAVKS